MYQVFSNLIGNAIKYKNETRAPNIEISVKEKTSRNCTILIKDNGQGIPKDKHEAVFRPFQRAHSGPVEGSGIGLACVKKLVERFGGKIELRESDPGGSTFELILSCSSVEAD